MVLQMSQMTQLLKMETEDGSRVASVARGEAEQGLRRTLLFVTMPGSVADCLLYAIERELPWLVIERVEHIQAACTKFAHPVSLILIDPEHVKAAEDAAADISRFHPQALTAVMEVDSHNPSSTFPEIFESKLIRGVLPMDLKLDVWLSVIRLMLRGGEYFPTGLFHSYADKFVRNSTARPANGSASPTAKNVAEDDLSDLTSREIEILEMVSRGLQNKAIAAALGLSEHTVKIHLHNIIRKLGAHNRTEAAARFHDYQKPISRQR